MKKIVDSHKELGRAFGFLSKSHAFYTLATTPAHLPLISSLFAIKIEFMALRKACPMLMSKA